MLLEHLSLTNFRNFSRLDLDVPAGTLVLVGSNAQGKTSFLEAIYYLATFSSFHVDSDRQLINFIAMREPLAVGRIEALFCRGGNSHKLEVRIICERNELNGATRVRKEILLDGVKGKMAEILGQFNAVQFLPQMMAIVDGSPQHRRRYLDLALAQVLPSYGPTLTAYRKTVSQRNALLKQLQERAGDTEQLHYWDQQLAYLGARLIFARIQAVRELEKTGARIHRDLTRGEEVLRLDYQPAFDPLPQDDDQYSLPLDAPVDRSNLSVEQIENGFVQRLQAIWAEEIARGVTTIGPHRDELRFLSNGIDMGTYGSRGQMRTTLLTLKLAEVDWMQARTGHTPVVLLDEVLAELDIERRVDLLDSVLECQQAVLTTTDLNLFAPEFVQKAVLWQVERGRIQPA